MKEVFTRVQEFMTSNAVIIASDATLPAAKLTKHSDFRHLPVVQNAGTMMLRRRYSIELVSKTHGHADISTTMNYVHLVSGAIENVAKTFSIMPTVKGVL